VVFGCFWPHFDAKLTISMYFHFVILEQTRIMSKIVNNCPQSGISMCFYSVNIWFLVYSHFLILGRNALCQKSSKNAQITTFSCVLWRTMHDFWIFSFGILREKHVMSKIVQIDTKSAIFAWFVVYNALFFEKSDFVSFLFWDSCKKN